MDTATTSTKSIEIRKRKPFVGTPLDCEDTPRASTRTCSLGPTLDLLGVVDYQPH